MGQTGSNMMKRYVAPLWGGATEEEKEAGSRALARFGGSPYVLTRQG